MNKRPGETLTTCIGVALTCTLISSVVCGQTTSPRNLQGPTQKELLAACQRESGTDRQRCEERVRANENPGEGSRNKSAAQQQAEQPKTQNRSTTDPGSATVPPLPSKADESARSRTDRTRASQRSDQIKDAPRPRSEPNPVNSVDAAPTRVDDDKDGNAKDVASSRSNDKASRESDPSNDANTTNMPSQDRAQSRPQEKPRRE